MQKITKYFLKLNVVIGVVLMALPIAYIIAINTPQIWYRINPNAVQDEINALTRDPFAETAGSINIVPQVLAEAPQQDENLSETNIVNIPSIGVNTEIVEGSNEEQALAKGVWRMPGFGTPVQNDKPVVLSAHRWGPTNISAEYRNQNMFINLPSVKPGDRVDIVWDQREYTYEIYAIKEENYVSEISDLILITCKYYNSPVRYIVYADRVS